MSELSRFKSIIHSSEKTVMVASDYIPNVRYDEIHLMVPLPIAMNFTAWKEQRCSLYSILIIIVKSLFEEFICRFLH